MFEQLREHRFLGILVGLIVAGIVGGLAAIAGVPEPYPIVVALAVYVPIGALVGSGSRFDLDAYLAQRGTSGLALDVAVTAAGALLGGIAAVILVAAELDGFLQVAVIAVGAFLGGQVIFFARSHPFHHSNPADEA